jgi:TonB family protein
MSDHRRHAENPLAIGERRIHARIPVTPQAFVKFGENNYGFVFNISESGLVFAPTETLTLAVGATAKMRFQLPDSKEWIETGGEVAWIAESQKEAGVCFVDLTEDTRLKIRNWISQEPSRDITEPVRDDKLLNSIFADPGLFLVESKSTRPKAAVQPRPAVADERPPETSASHIPERRSQIRRRVLSLEYLDLGDSNGGIIINLSEGGMYVQAVASLSADLLSSLSFRIPDSGYQVETTGRIAWVGESRKDAGIQFVDLPEEARLKIREWVAAENPAREGAGKSSVNPPPTARKHERIVEMPRSTPSTTSASTANPAVEGFPQKQTDLAGKSLNVDTSLPVARKPADIPPAAAQLRTSPEDGKTFRTDSLASENSIPPIAASTASAATDSLASPPLVRRRRWVGMAAAIIVVVIISFGAGWIAAGTNGRKQFMDLFASRPANSSEPADAAANSAARANAAADAHSEATPTTVSAEPAVRPPSSTITENRGVTATENPKKQLEAVAALPGASNTSNVSATRANSPSFAPSDAARELHNSSQPPLSAATPSTGSATGNKSRQPQSAQPAATVSSAASSNPASIAAKNTQPITTNVPASVPVNGVASRTPNATQPLVPPPAAASSTASSPPNANPPGTQPPARADSTSSSTAKPVEPAEIVKGTVSVSASPFPSLHVPPELKSQISRQGASLQIGLLVSRVEPVYPEDAQHQRIEGVVKLHIIIGRDGNVQDVDQMSGPPLLVAAAANAIRQWRYKPTSLGGEPVEAGESITVTFRLQPTHAN